jgi:phosphatidylglycerophosphatase A
LEPYNFLYYFGFQSAFMNDQNHHLDTLQDIKQMMERSSRFISLSGLSGIAAGICALTGAWFAKDIIDENRYSYTNLKNTGRSDDGSMSLGEWMGNQLFQIAVITFIAAFVLAFIFTYTRSKKTNTPIWGSMAKRVLINVAIPMMVGGIYLFKLMENEAYGYIAPG